MSMQILLLRGINVGGHNKLPMAALRASLERAGYADVASYIQSGNVVLRAGSPPEETASAVKALLAREFGLQVPVLAMTAATMARALADAPFAPDVDPAQAHLFFLMPGPDLPDISDLAPAPGDAARLTPGHVAHYLETPEGLSRSRLAEQLTRRLAGHATARNLRSCRKLLDMAGDDPA